MRVSIDSGVKQMKQAKNQYLCMCGPVNQDVTIATHSTYALNNQSFVFLVELERL